MKKATLVFFVKDNQILLAMKKRGFGAGYYNGAGGKPEPGETIEQTAARECREEVGLNPLKLEKVADIDFYFGPREDKSPDNLTAVVFLSTKWEGEVVESEEMLPKWFNIDDIPYEDMWPDDKYWLPLVLIGRKVKASFIFGENDTILDQELEII